MTPKALSSRKPEDCDGLIHDNWNIAHSARSPRRAALKCYWYKGVASMANVCALKLMNII